jgi:hypothetical protein
MKRWVSFTSTTNVAAGTQAGIVLTMLPATPITPSNRVTIHLTVSAVGLAAADTDFRLLSAIVRAQIGNAVLLEPCFVTLDVPVPNGSSVALAGSGDLQFDTRDLLGSGLIPPGTSDLTVTAEIAVLNSGAAAENAVAGVSGFWEVQPTDPVEG